ncbi:VOC family protein [Catelliglobosispora koreensis]|uniref:VOC family protein n=1 Tax=Catelliglobosispora koreensis TaxID=129052 RepID=UPI0004781062|nr:VOC family protein [Catelliglobosispora koreensis]
MPGPVVHWEIGGRDMAALAEFYRAAFDWTMTPAGPEYTLVESNGQGVGGGIMQCREGMPPYVTVYFGVPDLEAKLRDVERLGGKTVVPPTQVRPGMSFALFSDPEGNVVGILHEG